MTYGTRYSNLRTNNSEYPVKGVGNQTGGGLKVRNLKIVENDWGKKFVGDALQAQTYLPHD